MLIPTPQDISKIIDKVRALEKAKFAFWKKRSKSVDDLFIVINEILY